MSKHTPGPWRVCEMNPQTIVAGPKADVTVVAECRTHVRDQRWRPMMQKAQANAQIIAAAPELEDAAEVALEALAAGPRHMLTAKEQEAIEVLNWALAKAEGE